MVKLTIDNKAVEIEDGKTVLDAAKKASIKIPTLCSHESLSPAGSCRLCVVEIAVNGKSELTAACTYPVESGLKVLTNTERVITARKFALQLLLAQSPHSSQIQDIARTFGIEKPELKLKENECVLCRLCVRSCHEIVGVDAITFIAQGKDRQVDESTVIHSLEKCIGCDSCAFICPTEAITVKDVVDTRTIITPSGKLEFKLKKCNTCGTHWAPEKQLDYIIKKWNLEPDLFDTCPDCRE